MHATYDHYYIKEGWKYYFGNSRWWWSLFIVWCVRSPNAHVYILRSHEFVNAAVGHITTPVARMTHGKFFHSGSTTLPALESQTKIIYRKTSNIIRSLVDNKIVDHSDVVGASRVGAAPTTSSFSTWHLASRDSAKKAARQYENLLSVGIWCVLN